MEEDKTETNDVSFANPQPKNEYMLISMVLLCLSVISQSMMVTGALNVCISTIEKLYHYASFHVAFIDITYNFGFALSAFSLGYMVIRRKLRVVGFGMLFVAIGCIVFMSPVVMIRKIENDTVKSSYLCENQTFIKNMECKFGSSLYLIIMCAAYFAIGIGAAPLHTVAINFIQENTSPKQGGLFFGIFYTAAAFGPAFMFVLYSFVIKIPLMISNNTNSILTPKDESWVGAYWIVYAVGGTLSLFVSIPMIFYSKKMKSSSTSEFAPIKFGKKRLVSLSKKVFTNPEFILVTMAMFFDGMMNNAIGVFLSKYIEAQFKLTTDKAALYSGLIIVSGAAIGLFSGGLSIRIFNWNTRRLITVIAITSAAGVVALFFLFFHCSENSIKGVANLQNNLIFLSQTAKDCNCDPLQFLPVCSPNKNTYFSPCAIGCKNQEYTNVSNLFSGCSNEFTSSGIVSQGRCSGACNVFYIFMITGCICLIIEFYIYTPQIAFSTRVLEDDSRLLGLSLQQILVRISYMLGPLYQGKFFDMSCKLFGQLQNCKQTSNCIDYNLKSLSFSIAIPAIVLKLLATACLTAAVFVEKSRVDKPDEK